MNNMQSTGKRFESMADAKKHRKKVKAFHVKKEKDKKKWQTQQQ